MAKSNMILQTLRMLPTKSKFDVEESAGMLPYFAMKPTTCPPCDASPSSSISSESQLVCQHERHRLAAKLPADMELPL